MPVLVRAAPPRAVSVSCEREASRVETPHAPGLLHEYAKSLLYVDAQMPQLDAHQQIKAQAGSQADN